MKKIVLLSVLSILSGAQAQLFADGQADVPSVKKCTVKSARGIALTAVGAALVVASGYVFRDTLPEYCRGNINVHRDFIVGAFGCCLAGFGILVAGLRDLKNNGGTVCKAVRDGCLKRVAKSA